MDFKDLEEDLKEKIELKYEERDDIPDRVYFNKGLQKTTHQKIK